MFGIITSIQFEMKKRYKLEFLITKFTNCEFYLFLHDGTKRLVFDKQTAHYLKIGNDNHFLVNLSDPEMFSKIDEYLKA